MLREESIQTLMDLGLSLLQAKTYLALSTLGNATIKQISKTSNIARQDLYRIMPTLQKLGLVEQIIISPVVYRATPIDMAVSILLQHKTDEYDSLQKNIERLLSNFQETSPAPSAQDDTPGFLVISEKNLLYKTLDKLNRAVKKTLDVSGKWESTRSALFYEEIDVFKAALKRGVRIRWVTETHDEDKSTVRILRVLEENPLFEIRYFVPPIPLQAAIYDGHQVCMCIASPASSDITSMWSDNAMFVRVASNYFEEIWNSSVGNNLENVSEKSVGKMLKEKL